MAAPTYDQTRQKLTTYFDRTAADAWEKLTSEEPVGRIRQTVRDGREQMHQTLLGWLPADMHGLRVLDAGCGTGVLAMAFAARGAEVVAVDVSPTLIGFARQRLEGAKEAERIDFRVGDMRDPAFGEFDFVVAMDSLIHYHDADIASVLASLAPRVRQAILVTYAPRTTLLSMMHVVGRMIPTREHKAPAIVPVTEKALRSAMHEQPSLARFDIGRTRRISSGFYKSQALEITRQ
ncbi:MAG: magnesium protoporphyrin IX methyltransferase [Pseudomonadota bacterium]